ncbi:MAG TPA: hypothetical protein DCS93_01330 [Microscillaceae bacterium]|nr:hypothetical protein [Microscillaceae bacterium]
MSSTSGQSYYFGPQVSEQYKDVFKVFSAAAGSCVADQLATADSDDSANRPLLVVGGTQMSIFSNSNSEPINVVFRGGNAQGFNELTAISHIGVAMGYFAQLKQQGKPIRDTSGVANMTNFKTKLEALLAQNEKNDNDYWLNKVTANVNPYLVTKTSQIQQMISYACKHAIGYITKYLNNESGYDMSYPSLHTHFYNDGEDGSVGFNQIMVATFCLVTVDSALYLRNLMMARDADGNLKIPFDWSKAIIMVNGQAGGISSGLNTGTSSTYVTLSAIAGRDLSNQILFAPYAVPSYDAIVHGTYSSETDRTKDYKTLASAYRGQYFNLVARQSVAYQMFDENVPMLPQTYPTWADSANTVSTLIARMKTCMADKRQLMSNCIASACVNMLVEANWDISKINLPGFDDNWNTSSTS